MNGKKEKALLSKEEREGERADGENYVGPHCAAI
jgi:hypothetical protein